MAAAQARYLQWNILQARFPKAGACVQYQAFTWELIVLSGNPVASRNFGKIKSPANTGVPPFRYLKKVLRLLWLSLQMSICRFLILLICI